MSVAENKRVVRRYFDAVRQGDPELADLFADDVSWWVPPSSPLGGLHDGKAAVLALMSSGTGLYDADHPMELAIERMLAEDDWVSVELTLDARTAAGEPYRNHYHFAFRIADGRICEVREHLDTLYAQQKLFS